MVIDALIDKGIGFIVFARGHDVSDDLVVIQRYQFGAMLVELQKSCKAMD